MCRVMPHDLETMHDRAIVTPPPLAVASSSPGAESPAMEDSMSDSMSVTSTASTTQQQPILLSARPGTPPVEQLYICTNCWATNTATWRRYGSSLLCNACGIYAKTHGRPRPAALYLKEKRGPSAKALGKRHSTGSVYSLPSTGLSHVAAVSTAPADVDSNHCRGFSVPHHGGDGFLQPQHRRHSTPDLSALAQFGASASPNAAATANNGSLHGSNTVSSHHHHGHKARAQARAESQPYYYMVPAKHHHHELESGPWSTITTAAAVFAAEPVSGSHVSRSLVAESQPRRPSLPTDHQFSHGLR